MKYDQIKQFLTKTEDQTDSNVRKILNAQQADELQQSFPNLPSEYIDYLKGIGAGSFLQNRFMVYESPLDLSAIGLNEIYPSASHIHFFGDNFAGDFAGFDLSQKDSLVIELWHDTGELNYTNKKFQSYIKEQMQDDEKETAVKPWWKFW
ncbi:hypothetical protein [Flavobacterium sp.]|uniref:hypothetical protein n=1 Tax=Flavobacterium sp. TaxID=239 RepID=UPI0039E6AE8F